MIKQERLFPGVTMFSVGDKIRQFDLDKTINEMGEHLSPVFKCIFERAMIKDPKKRATANELLKVIEVIFLNFLYQVNNFNSLYFNECRET